MDLAKIEVAILADIRNPDKKIKRLEAFLTAVAKEVKCLPNYADPSPEGNDHIMQKIRSLSTDRSAK